MLSKEGHEVAEHFDVTPASLHAAGGTWRGQAPVVEAALRRLQGQLDALGQPWGDDEAGRAFAAQYRPEARKVMSAVEQLARGLDAMADGLDLMGRRYQAAEGASGLDGSGR